MIDPNIQRIIDSNKKFKTFLRKEKVIDHDVIVKYSCKHVHHFLANSKDVPVWVVGGEWVSWDGRIHAVELYGLCPQCEVYRDSGDDAAKTISDRDADSDQGELQTGNKTASS